MKFEHKRGAEGLWPVRIRPIRDWNSKESQAADIESAVRIRPIRDWNSTGMLSIRISTLVRIRPIRDWN